MAPTIIRSPSPPASADAHENFYWLQEDYLREAAARHGFSWTIWRPQLVVGGAVGAAMNLAPVIGAFAALAAEEGVPFGFPGGAPYVWEAVDAALIARALQHHQWRRLYLAGSLAEHLSGRRYGTGRR